MNRTEAAMLLTIASSYDDRRAEVTDEDAVAWAAALPEVDFEQARGALVLHYRESTMRVMPADILRRVRIVRRDNITGADPVTPPSILADDPGREQEWVRLYRWRIGAGDTAAAAQTYACGRMGIAPDPTPAVVAPGRLRAILDAARTRAVPDA